MEAKDLKQEMERDGGTERERDIKCIINST